MKYSNCLLIQFNFVLLICLWFSIIYCVNATPIIEKGNGVSEENTSDLNEAEAEDLSLVRNENSNANNIENNGNFDNGSKSVEIEYKENNEEILKPFKYAQKQILIVLSSLLDDENSLKTIFEKNDKMPKDKVFGNPEDLEVEKNTVENSEENEPTSEANRPKAIVTAEVSDNKKLVKILMEVKDGVFASFCPQGPSMSSTELFELLQNFVKKMISSKKSVKDLIKKINLIINKNGEEESNRLRNNFAAIIKRFNSRKLQKHLHYIQDINQNNNNNIIEDFEAKLNFFLFLSFWSISSTLREEAENKLKNSVPEGNLFFSSLENEAKLKNFLRLQINVSDCLLNGLVKKLENVVIKSILENDQVELIKQVVRMTFSPFIKHPYLVNNAFGIQQTVNNVCDINLIHKNPLLIFKKFPKNNKLENVKDLIFGSIFNLFYYIGGFLGATYHQMIAILEEAKKKVEEETKESKALKNIQINRFFGHFYEILLTKYGKDIEGSEFAKWLVKLKEMLLKEPKIAKKRIMEKFASQRITMNEKAAKQSFSLLVLLQVYFSETLYSVFLTISSFFRCFRRKNA
ncbi:hypothetical protein Mgra_00006449 [Meloidogyne graminicola]|uniref:Fatty-acid and retinol-binding protein 1 n=1 Tax=Meloidogyne graminicola TaxID=189291 RepID=A0A8S9ZLI0_9BILA|nr:hypothetical protein Mgra_00006449 [Meloidogyne graminicola]